MKNTSKNWMKHRIALSRDYQDRSYDDVNGIIIVNRKGKQVELDSGQKLTEFVSCSYLGIDQDERVISAASESLDKFGFSFHSARTRIQPKPHLDLEDYLRKIYCGSCPVVFPTIHMIHLGIFPLLGSGEMPGFPVRKNGITFIIDKTAHSSIQINRGLLEQFGNVNVVSFDDIEAIDKAFTDAKHNNTTPIAIADSVGSMGGIAPIHDLIRLSEQFDGYVYLDDAHGTSVHGKHGAGYVLEALDYDFHHRLILVTSLGKAFGSIGGAVFFKNKRDTDFAKRFSPTYIFSGPPALPIINSAIASAKIHLSNELALLQNKLWNNVRYFDNKLHDHILNTNTASPIRGVFIGDENKAIDIATNLKNKGFILTTAMYPTVAKNESMLRMAFSALHIQSDIDALCENLIASMHDFSIKKVNSLMLGVRSAAEQ